MKSMVGKNSWKTSSLKYKYLIKLVIEVVEKYKITFIRNLNTYFKDKKEQDIKT